MEKKVPYRKNILRWILYIIGFMLLLFVFLVLYLTITEYKPDKITSMVIDYADIKEVPNNSSFKIVSFNIGYGGLGEEEDFFMDGGKKVFPDNIEIVEKNLAGIAETLKEIDADFHLLQEVDLNSKRSFSINQQEYLEDKILGKPSFYAENYKVKFVPIPFPPMGKVDSGLVTSAKYNILEADRISLFVPFKWPVRIANLKRSLLVTRMPVENSDKELVLINLHLEAYDDSGGREKQTKELMELMEDEVAKGNYVVAGGDFNQSFFPLEDLPYETTENQWEPGMLDFNLISEDFQVLRDESMTPTCRSNHIPYTAYEGKNYYYYIDGFILSDNINVENIAVYDGGFKFSDHNPVVLEFSLR